MSHGIGVPRDGHSGYGADGFEDRMIPCTPDHPEALSPGPAPDTPPPGTPSPGPSPSSPSSTSVYARDSDGTTSAS